MAETTPTPAKTTTRPSRSRGATAAGKTTPEKNTPARAAKPAAKAETPAAESAVTVTSDQRIVIELEPAGETARFTKWVAPEGSGCTGTFYAPLGAGMVKVAISAGA